MKLLIITQAVDTEDPVLGFFVRWIAEFSKHTERTEVICLKLGRSDLPENVRIHSLGKPCSAKATQGGPRTIFNFWRRVLYAFRFLSLVWRLRHEYDAVFVHMNQEYVLLAGPLWKLLGRPVYLWRNHYAGSSLTDLAASFCTKVFCTSKHSYTAKYPKTVFMPVGVDTERFFLAFAAKAPDSILFLSRMSPAKRPDMLLAALTLLAQKGVEFSATFVGSPLAADQSWYDTFREQARTLGTKVTFRGAVRNSDTPALYQSHQIFVNTSPSGMFDKTLFEAAACGCQVLSSSRDFALLAGEGTYFDSAETLAARLEEALAAPAGAVTPPFVLEHSLSALGEKLFREV